MLFTHFSAALLLSVILTAPWPTRFAAQLALTTIGAAGTAYTVVVLRRARGQNDYRPVFEDWLFHAGLPFAAYVIVLAAALGMARLATACLFVIGGAAVLLLFIGIHNAWDTVTDVVIARWEAGRAREGEPPDRAKAT